MFHISRFIAIIGLACLLSSADELSELFRRAEASNPSLQAARERVEQSRQKHEELLEFLDPSLFAAAGVTKDARALPLSPLAYRTLTDHAAELQGGVQVPISGGAYLSAGAATRRFFDTDSETGHFYQNLLGLQVSVPLLRDRGFALHGWEKEAAMAEYNETAALLLSESQSLRHSLELSFITSYETLANCRLQAEAVARFQRFLDNAKEMASLKSIPEYQVHAAVYELQIGRDDEAMAKNRHQLALVEVASLIGDGQPITLTGGPNHLVELCEGLELPSAVPAVESVLENRGDIIAILQQIKQIHANLSYQEEEGKDEVLLNAGVTFQAEGHNHIFQAHRLVSDDYFGSEINVIWRRPLHNRGHLARRHRLESAMAEARALLEQQTLTVTTQLRQAELSLQSARQRLEIARQGIQAANDNVEAEQQRFQLGETTSQAVLDAQKNYNAILLRLNTASADLLRALADFRYACGYPAE